MRTSHGSGNSLAPDFANEQPNKADISGMADGLPSDALNDALGRPREGSIQPPPTPPHFVSLRVNTDEHNPVQDRVDAGTVYAGFSPKSPGYVPPKDFEPFTLDGQLVIWGWLPLGDSGDWVPIENVRKLTVASGRVTAIIDEERVYTLADFGTSEAANNDATVYRARVAWYIAQCKGWEIPTAKES